MGTKRISGPSISSLRMTGVVVPLGKARTIFPGCTVRSGSTKTVEPFGMETPHQMLTYCHSLEQLQRYWPGFLRQAAHKRLLRNFSYNHSSLLPAEVIVAEPFLSAVKIDQANHLYLTLSSIKPIFVYFQYFCQ